MKSKLLAAVLAASLLLATAVQAQDMTFANLFGFGVIAGSTITNTGNSVITGNVGLSPGSAITGFPPGHIAGVGHVDDTVAVQVKKDLATFHNMVVTHAPTGDLTGKNLGGMTLHTGMYKFDSSAQLTGVLTLDAKNDPNAVFIFDIGSALTTASKSSVKLINGAKGANVYWLVQSSATLGTGTVFVGNIMAEASITLTTGAALQCGSAMAMIGAVTLDTNKISVCQP
jgi:type VI secretion system secreted protein VgrG